MNQRRKTAHGIKQAVIVDDEERFRLVGGPYEPPFFKGEFLVDAVRGKVIFAKYSNARIPWPIFKRKGRGGSGGYVLCGDLVRALKHESAAAICHHWGVCEMTVVKWRRALGLKGRSAGAQRMVNIGLDLCKLPQSQAKLVARAKVRGMSEEGKESIRLSIAERRKRQYAARRAFYQRTGRFPKADRSCPWIPEEESLLAKHPTRELIKILGRPWNGIKHHRRRLKIRLRPTDKPWGESELKLLGTQRDDVVAKRLGRSVAAVNTKRKKLGIPAFRIEPC